MYSLATMLFDLSAIENNLINGWIGPVFLGAVAIFAIVFIKDRAWMKLIGFVGIAAVVGVLVFAGGTLFGSSTHNTGKLGNVAKAQVNGAS